jgi:hypothetical protein
LVYVAYLAIVVAAYLGLLAGLRARRQNHSSQATSQA